MTEPEQSLFDPETVRDLLRRLRSTDVDELEIVRGSSRLYLRREPGLDLEARPDHVTAVRPHPGVPVVAPLTGVFYARPNPDEAPFVVVGDRVEPGQVVALIETMKLFNEVTVDVTGEVLSVAVADGSLVEVGQALLYVKVAEETEEP